MTPIQIDLVQRSFADVKPIAATAADLFYHRRSGSSVNRRW